MKKLIALTLSLLMVFTVVPMIIISASADSTETELPFSADYFTLSDNTADLSFTTASEGYKMIAGGLSEGTGVTMTSTVKLEPGVYDTTIYARARATRPPFDIEVNGTLIGEAVDTSNTVLGTDNNAPVSLKSVTIPSATYVTIKITGSAGASGWLYLNSIKFTKTSDCIVPVEMKSGAEIRLSEQRGIRFLTKIDTAKIAELEADGYTVEYGTLIAPKDLLDGAELTFDLDATKYVDIPYKVKEWHDEDGLIAGSLISIKEVNIARDFIGRGYVKVTKNGDTSINYANYESDDVANNTRSLAYIANALKGDAESYGMLTDEIKDLVDDWASFYINDPNAKDIF